MASNVRTLIGDLIYLRDEGGSWGREHFSMSVWNGGRAMRSVTEFDDRKVLRDACWSVGPNWEAREGYTREVIDGRFVAESWISVDGDTVECQARTDQLGRVSQRLSVGRTTDYLGLHTILADCLVAAPRGCSEAGAEKPIVCVTNSVADYGMGGYCAQAVTPLVTYVGRETVEVQAGRLEGEHFRVRWSDYVPAYSNFWVTPGDFIPLRLRGASGPVSYELARLEER